MDYEKKYKDALGRAKAAIRVAEYQEEVRKVAETIFPELRESEDERHIKWILEYLYDGLRKADEQFKDHFKSAIDWLEKQKEPKEELFVRINGLINEYIKAGADEAEQEHRLKCYHLFLDSLEDAEYFEQKEQEPLTTEKTELNSLAFLEQLGYTCIPSGAKTEAEWSEEDEANLNMIIRVLEDNESDWRELSDWLKSLRPQPKQEWTDDDEQHLEWLCRIIHSRKIHGELSLTEESELGNWIDKWINHNPQPRWKPSEEQIEALKRVFYNRPIGTHELTVLESLYDELKNLK